MGWLKTRNDHRERVTAPSDIFSTSAISLTKEHMKGVKNICTSTTLGYKIAYNTYTGNPVFRVLEAPDAVQLGYIDGTEAANNNAYSSVGTFRGSNNLTRIYLPRLRILGWYALPYCINLNTFRSLEQIYPYGITHAYFRGSQYPQTYQRYQCFNLPSIKRIEYKAFSPSLPGQYSRTYAEYGVILGPNLEYLGAPFILTYYTYDPNPPYPYNEDAMENASLIFMGYTPPTTYSSFDCRYQYASGATVYPPIYVRKSALTVANGGTYEGSDPTVAFDLAPNLSSKASRMKPYTWLCVFYDEDKFTCTLPAAKSINGEAFVAPIAPTKTGYTFDGWYNEADDTLYDFETIPTGDINLYAKWTEVTP